MNRQCSDQHWDKLCSSAIFSLPSIKGDKNIITSIVKLLQLYTALTLLITACKVGILGI